MLIGSRPGAFENVEHIIIDINPESTVRAPCKVRMELFEHLISCTQKTDVKLNRYCYLTIFETI